MPKTSTTALPLHQDQEQAVVSPCFPRSPEMQLGDRDSSVPTGLVSSGLSSEGPSQTAEHDTGSLMSQASRLNDPPSDKWETEGGPLAGAGHVVVVKAKGAVIDSVDPGTFLCPDSATRNPKIIFEVPPPGPNIGAGDDNAAAKLPPPLTLPGSWTLVAPAGSEELGAPLSTGPGVDALLPTPTADPDNDAMQLLHLGRRSASLSFVANSHENAATSSLTTKCSSCKSYKLILFSPFNDDWDV